MTAWIRSLPDRYGRTTLILLAAILALGFGLRAYRVVEPLATPGDDAHAYYELSKSLYDEGSYGAPEFGDASDWSPGRAAALRGAPSTRPAGRGKGRRGSSSCCSGWRRSSSSSCSAGGSPAAGRADRRARGRRLPALHPLDRRPLQRAAGDLHACRRPSWPSCGPRRHRRRLLAGGTRGRGGAAGLSATPLSSASGPAR